MLAAVPHHGPADTAAAITQSQLQGIVAEAISHWETVVGDVPGITAMEHESAQVTNLSSGYLGLTTPESILIDADAAGYGWYVQPTGAASDFRSLGDFGSLLETAIPGSPAAGKMDLLTVVTHELGHLLGYQDDHMAGIMQQTLTAGTRILPSDPSAAVTEGPTTIAPNQAGALLVPQASLMEAAGLLRGDTIVAAVVDAVAVGSGLNDTNPSNFAFHLDQFVGYGLQGQRADTFETPSNRSAGNTQQIANVGSGGSEIGDDAFWVIFGEAGLERT
jgi:hypothetical protein